ncbi:S1C family serine protease [Vallicoccus soli]|uniref:PDZ domain-containing protein n=1 Tax=Vallicoccus soli TaxID=2339232 RepID=A0A3A3ZAC3_9ACTN|nr:trypsin-like peptidase domain-containing protein [Vallicoccus soli]RJK98036.1 PDZ domain-containing protein [Vallicoccus soli]
MSSTGGAGTGGTGADWWERPAGASGSSAWDAPGPGGVPGTGGAGGAGGDAYGAPAAPGGGAHGAPQRAPDPWAGPQGGWADDPFGPSPYSAPGTSPGAPAAAWGDPFGGTGGGYPPPAPPRPVRRLGAGAALALALLAGVVGGGVGGTVGYLAADRQEGSVLDGDARLGPSATRSSERPPESVAGVAARLLPSVVSIAVEGTSSAGTGSGFVLREDGYVLTNNHVVAAGASGGEITVSFDDGSERPARIVGRDPNYDLAVIKVEARDLPVAALADSDDVVVGDPVIAVGSPLGLSGTVTTGIVSALDRPVTAGESSGSEAAFINAIQTDAAINPGNSGGPLVDATGRVIGVNSAIATTSSGLGGQSGSIGLGFAIPMNQAKRTAEQLIETGRATYPIIGAVLDGRFGGEGARVRELTAGGPADSAGLREGDVVTSIDGRRVDDSSELIVAIRALEPGDRVELTVERGGDEQVLQVELGESD